MSLSSGTFMSSKFGCPSWYSSSESTRHARTPCHYESMSRPDAARQADDNPEQRKQTKYICDVFQLPCGFIFVTASSNVSAGDDGFLVLPDALGESLAMAAWMPPKNSMSSSLLCFLTAILEGEDPLASDLTVNEDEHGREPRRGARWRTISAGATKFSASDFTRRPRSC